MQVVEAKVFGGPEVLEVAERPSPVPAAGEVLVKVHAAGVNFMDTFVRAGSRGGEAPVVPGAEGAGRVTALGEGVSGVALGDRVAWKTAPASYAEEVVVSFDQLVPLPEEISEEVAAAVLLQGLTAQYLADSTHPVAPGEVALVHAAAGGVGLLLTQIIVNRGGRVVATVSSPEKEALARAAGAELVVGYDDVAGAVAEATGGGGVAVAYDAVGKATFDASLAALAPFGTLALYGAASGPVPPFDLSRLSASRKITRPSLGDYTRSRDELLERAERLFGWILAGTLDVRIGARYPFSEAAAAHRDLEGRGTTGKLLLIAP
ncbi:MAG TPA: quinone oxidoreductase [Acidimicrobiales bacterium]|nr:quinone oxidoreductase [Acidimicrobiales bacterium]